MVLILDFKVLPQMCLSIFWCWVRENDKLVILDFYNLHPNIVNIHLSIYIYIYIYCQYTFNYLKVKYIYYN